MITEVPSFTQHSSHSQRSLPAQHTSSSEFCQEANTGRDALTKSGQVKFLVRRMYPIVGQRKAQKHCRYCQQLLKGTDDRNGSAGTQENRCNTKATLTSNGGRTHCRMSSIDERRRCFEKGSDRVIDSRRSDA